MGPKGTSLEVDIEAFNRAMIVNVSSMILMAKHAIPEMMKNEGQVAGSIVNIGSTASLRGGHPAIFYPTSKGTVINMTRSMV
jgi:NAD(P)-dependent dehydrogenase (short-subunit alcohol dehydrogenase family)